MTKKEKERKKDQKKENHERESQYNWERIKMENIKRWIKEIK